jgi:hypothetical protein
MSVCAFLLVLLSYVLPSWAGDIEAFPDLNLNDPASLQEASRVLEEELKLASRPQTYLIIDLVTQSLHIKSRAVTLHQIPIDRSTALFSEVMIGTFRVVARPAVVRRKIDPTAAIEQEPISLADMPIHYELSCSPGLTLVVMPRAMDHPLQWTWVSGHLLWRQLTNWGLAWFVGSPNARHPVLRITLSPDHAQSLAWSLVDGMPLVVRRTTDR